MYVRPRHVSGQQSNFLLRLRPPFTACLQRVRAIKKTAKRNQREAAQKEATAAAQANVIVQPSPRLAAVRARHLDADEATASPRGADGQHPDMPK